MTAPEYVTLAVAAGFASLVGVYILLIRRETRLALTSRPPPAVAAPIDSIVASAVEEQIIYEGASRYHLQQHRTAVLQRAQRALHLLKIPAPDDLDARVKAATRR